MATTRITGTNEVVTEYHHDGGYDYDDLDDWEAATDLDLVNTEHNSPVLECHKGYHDAGSVINMGGATCNGTYRRIIRPVSADMHSGIPKTDGSIVCFAPDVANGSGLRITEAYSSLQDLCVIWAVDDASSCYGVYLNGGNNVAVGCMSKVTNTGVGVGLHTVTNGSSLVIVCLGFECKTDNFRINVAGTNVYNCTSDSAGQDGFDDVSAASTFKNCLAWGSGSDDYETIGTSVTCADEDGTGDFTLSAEPFVDSANDDYHLDTGADGIDDGTDVSGDGFGDDDIDFETRSGSWDVGFDEYVAVGTTSPPTTLAPTTLPTTAPPTTLPPTTLAPTTLPTTAPPTTLAPTTLPTTSPPTTLAPTTVAPTTPVPTTLPPTTLPPTTLAPTTTAPTTLAPTTLPTTSPPTTLAPTTLAPTTLPTTAVPTTLAPTTLPTTAAPTSLAPTTLPTTAAPTTAVPTTPAPTTVAPTTVAPTTAATTVAPTTIVTTVAPTTIVTTLAPTTTATTVAPTTVIPTLAPTTVAVEACVVELKSTITRQLNLESPIVQQLNLKSPIARYLNLESTICRRRA